MMAVDLDELQQLAEKYSGKTGVRRAELHAVDGGVWSLCALSRGVLQLLEQVRTLRAQRQATARCLLSLANVGYLDLLQSMLRTHRTLKLETLRTWAEDTNANTD
jgi:hypothetical protein